MRLPLWDAVLYSEQTMNVAGMEVLNEFILEWSTWVFIRRIQVLVLANVCQWDLPCTTGSIHGPAWKMHFQLNQEYQLIDTKQEALSIQSCRKKSIFPTSPSSPHTSAKSPTSSRLRSTCWAKSLSGHE